MKLLAVFVAVFVLVASVAGLKNAHCGERHSMVGFETHACAAFFPSWSYNSEINECVEFVYGGCGGNANRFQTKEECQTSCKE